MKNIRPILIVIVFAVVGLFAKAQVAQKQISYTSFSARIMTIDGDVLTGIIGFGQKRVTKTSIFSAFLAANKNTNYVPDEMLKERSNYSKNITHWRFGVPSKKRVLVNYQPPFQCAFGYIKSIEVQKKEVLLSLINNQKLSLVPRKGNLSLYVYLTNELQGTRKIKWSRIKSIEFISTKEEDVKEKGDLLFGTVETTNGNFTGLIAWDEQEQFLTDVFNGRNNGKPMKIPFKNIQSIEKQGNTGIVCLFNGDLYKLSSDIKELFTDFGNDVGNDNRGISVTNNQNGRVTVKWDSFLKINFLKELESLVDSRNNYSDSIKPIRAAVVSSENVLYKGDIIFNLSQELNIEYVNGFDSSGLYYQIPFSSIKAIRRSNDASSTIRLRNNSVVELFNSKEVDNRNDGVVIIQESNFKYLPWNNIHEIFIK